ncbi:endonuclease/exonuclease/phosphatase family protein [Hamadaea tsunoensis]|uniref:endonuclease/exonuclease/phosphatase family protein n=1 Tax=Hamadaea tsunoensis TaxID=53368 RepID=UPI00040B2D62|nr:endonuclease/exonuclease/phosphatase family protein [Hamadaea tsunoensis]
MTHLRRLPAILLWTAFAVLTLWTLLRLTGWDTWYPAVQLLAFTPYAVPVALVCVLVAALMKRWRATIALGVTTAALLVCVLPREIPGSGPTGGTVLRVATSNLQFGWATPQAVMDRARASDVDVLAVQEMTPEWLTAADAAGISALFPYRSVQPSLGAEGSGVFSRYPLTDTGARHMGDGWFYQAYGTVTRDGTSVRVESAHAASPYDARVTAMWGPVFAKEPGATPDGPLSVLLGDFNATLDHSVLRKLIATGYRDAASVRGDGLIGTWGPYYDKPLPPIAIDHVLADSRIGVAGVSAYQVAGTDHRFLTASLYLPS